MKTADVVTSIVGIVGLSLLALATVEIAKPEPNPTEIDQAACEDAGRAWTCRLETLRFDGQPVQRERCVCDE